MLILKLYILIYLLKTHNLQRLGYTIVNLLYLLEKFILFLSCLLNMISSSSIISKNSSSISKSSISNSLILIV